MYKFHLDPISSGRAFHEINIFRILVKILEKVHLLPRDLPKKGITV
jgi:hypothetical protein